MGKGSRERDRGREGQLMPNGSKHHRTEANIYSIEGRTKGKAGSCSGLQGVETRRQNGRLEGRAVGSAFIGRPSDH
jgi:hypothetical protein